MLICRLALSNHVQCRTPTSYAEAACWAVQESARQCVAARLRTHYGGPAQTFAALEAGLEARLSKVRHMSSLPHQGEFLHRSPYNIMQFEWSDVGVQGC